MPMDAAASKVYRHIIWWLKNKYGDTTIENNTTNEEDICELAIDVTKIVREEDKKNSKRYF